MNINNSFQIKDLIKKNVIIIEFIKKHAKKLLMIYFLLTLIFIVVQFKGSFTELFDRMRSYKEYVYFSFNIIPFRTLSTQLERIGELWALLNIVINIIWFIPLGFLLPFYNQKFKKSYYTLGIVFLVVTFKEILQHITLCGMFDVDDIIINFIGGIIGYFIYKLIIYMEVFDL